MEFLRADPRTRVDSDLVWTRPSGHPVTYDEYVTALRRIFRRAGLPPRGGHQLRHSACSLMVAAGVHPRIIMAIMGHGSASTTMAIYAHVGPDSLANWSAAMDRLFGGEQNRAGG